MKLTTILNKYLKGKQLKCWCYEINSRINYDIEKPNFKNSTNFKINYIKECVVQIIELETDYEPYEGDSHNIKIIGIKGEQATIFIDTLNTNIKIFDREAKLKRILKDEKIRK